MDEAAHASEAETLLSLIANVKMAQEGRVHGVLVGDMKQLGPVYMSSHATMKFLNANRGFHFRPKMRKQYESMFERLFRADRCRVSWLTSHYRMHPDLAAVTLGFMYHDILLHLRPIQEFVTPFTNVEGPQGLRVVTVVDTRLCLDRFEGNSGGRVDGRLFNDFEIDLVQHYLVRLNRNRGDFNLKDNIIVAAPYVQQKNRIAERLTQSPNFCSNHPSAPDLNVVIETTDALQGSERAVALISLTRSNVAREVGFLRDDRRLNVAFTRARNATIIIGDFSTMTRCAIAEHVYSAAAERASGTVLQFFQPRRSRIDTFQRAQVRRLMLN